jgi:Ala-tRNA(Pro) deacylase
MSIPNEIVAYLEEHDIKFEAIHHRRDFTAQETAADTHTKGVDFAKTVIMFVDNAKMVNLASEEEIATICPGCEVGAMPPFGSLYQIPVYVSQYLKADHNITFNAGTHEDVIRMLYADFEKLENPQLMDLTVS